MPPGKYYNAKWQVRPGSGAQRSRPGPAPGALRPGHAAGRRGRALHLGPPRRRSEGVGGAREGLREGSLAREAL